MIRSKDTGGFSASLRRPDDFCAAARILRTRAERQLACDRYRGRSICRPIEGSIPSRNGQGVGGTTGNVMCDRIFGEEYTRCVAGR